MALQPGAHTQRGRPWLAIAATCMALSLWTWWSETRSAAETETTASDQQDGGTVGLGEAASTASRMDAPEFLPPEVLSEGTLPQPQPGQTRPDAKGRCPRKHQVALNGGCWVADPMDPEKCTDLRGQMHKGVCYVPLIPPERPPASSPGRKR
jgi:hypothetical protein